MPTYTRSSSITVNTPGVLLQSDVDCNGHVTQTIFHGTAVVETVGKTWIVDPLYNHTVASGGHPTPHPYTKTHTILRRPNGFTRADYCTDCGNAYKHPRQDLSGTFFGYESDLDDPGLPVDSDSDLRALAVNKSILNARADLNLLLSDFYQRQQTIDLVANTVRRIAHSIRYFKKGQFGDGLRVLGSPSGRRNLRITDPFQQYLEIQYAWKPLLSDVYDVVEALKPLNPIIKSIGRARSEKSNHGVASVFGEQLFYDQKSRKTCEAILYWTCRGEGALLHAMQGGVVAPLEVAWDLLPWSFVFDWFLPIGDYLQALANLASLDFVSGTTSIKHKSEDKRKASFSAPRCAYTSGYYSFSWEKFRLQRWVETSPTFTLRGTSPLSTTHLLEAFSLLATCFGRNSPIPVSGR